ncbi:AbrB/MazE/SpoVT family DNA-binding domain-containing protein [Laceyella putida]|uniref:AbrB/MazE/SpoVT family DNA-binding domain-containing protein n=1 Tax=Laceyella putida TaxID=110101 RepID=A0ABW2RIZ8_9BACL
MNDAMKNAKVFSKVTSKGQIIVPEEIREKLNIKEGDHIAFVEVDGQIVVQKAEVVPFPSNPDLYRSYQRTKERYEEALKNLKER